MLSAVCYLVTLIWLDLYRWLVWLVCLAGSRSPAWPQPVAVTFVVLIVSALGMTACATLAVGTVPVVLVAMPLLPVVLLRVASLRLLPVLRVAEPRVLPVLRVALPPVVLQLVVEVMEVPVALAAPEAPAGVLEALLRLLLAVLHRRHLPLRRLLRHRRAEVAAGGAG